MSISPKDIRKAFRKLADLLADEAERNPEFATALEDVFKQIPTARYKIANADRSEQSEKKVPAPDPFEVFRAKSSEDFHKWLEELSVDQLRAIVREHGFDPARLSDKWKTKERFVKIIVERVTDRSKQGNAFRHYGAKIDQSSTLEDLTTNPERSLTMAAYYVNKNAQSNGDHEVHKSGCSYMPSTENRIYLGDFSSCTSAVREARKHYSQVNGCYYCSAACHTS